MRKRNRFISGVLITALSAAFAPPTGAVPLTFEFGGVIDFVEDGLPISEQIAVGTPYAGIYQFDPEGVVNASDLPTLGAYEFGSAGFMIVSIESLTLRTSNLSAAIENSTLLDRYVVFNGSPFVAHSVSWQGMALDLRDLTHTAFESTELPLTAPDLNDFQFSRLFSLRQVDHRFPSITGTVDTLTMIPEPSSLVSLFAAAMMVSLRRWHRSRPANHATPEP